MGWDNCHLHEFEVGERRYSVPDPDFALTTQAEPVPANAYLAFRLDVQ
jgi:hypothetical protein